MFDLLLHVTLSTQVDQLLAAAVFNRQLVVAATGGRALAAQDSLGFIRGQGVWHRRNLVRHTPGNQRIVGITLQVGHYHFHADTRDCHRTEAVARPAGRHPQPATALVAAKFGAVPMELDLDPSVIIAIDVLTFGPGDTGRLADQHCLARNQRWTVEHIPGNGAEAITVTLGKAVDGFNVAGDCFLQYLRLLAQVRHTEQQPQVVALLAGVFSQVEEVAAAQGRLVTFTLCQLVVGTVPLQGLPGKLSAELFIFVQHRVAVVFQCRTELSGKLALQQQAWARWIIASVRGRAGTGAKAHGELTDDRVFRHEAAALLIWCTPQLGKKGLIVSKYELVTLYAVLVVPRNPIFTAQPLDELEIAFPILGTVLALWTGAHMKGIGISLDTMPLEHLGDDLRHCQMLENPLVVAELQVMQGRHQGQMITGQAFACFTHENIFQSAMNTFAIQAELKECRLT